MSIEPRCFYCAGDHWSEDCKKRKHADAGSEAAPLSVAGTAAAPLSEEDLELLNLRAENARKEELHGLLNARIDELSAENARLQSALELESDCLATAIKNFARLNEENARQAETIARLRDKIQWALRYLAGEEEAEPIDATLVLREALKEGT